MNIGKTLYLTDRNKWRSWLSKNYNRQPEIWLLFYNKASGKPRLSYDKSVLEALCFGWIDSIVKKVNDQSFAQRFSPRKNTSSLSQMNLERVRELIKQGKMTKAGLAAISHVYDSTKDNIEDFTFPPDILKAIKKNKGAWKNFQKFPPKYQRIRVAYLQSRKRHGISMYKKALSYFIKMTAQNKRIGTVTERKNK